MKRGERLRMATPGQLMEVVAECLGMPLASITGYDRHLADAGLRTKIGRGRHVAQVTARDAANLLTAILGGGQVKDAVSIVQRYQATKLHTPTSSKSMYGPIGASELSDLPVTHSFIDALEAVILGIARGSPNLVARCQSRDSRSNSIVDPLIEIAALTPGTVGDVRFRAVRGRGAHVRYAPPHPFSGKMKASKKEIESWQARIKVQPQSDLEQFRKISERTIGSVAKLLAD